MVGEFDGDGVGYGFPTVDLLPVETRIVVTLTKLVVVTLNAVQMWKLEGQIREGGSTWGRECRPDVRRQVGEFCGHELLLVVDQGWASGQPGLGVLDEASGSGCVGGLLQMSFCQMVSNCSTAFQSPKTFVRERLLDPC